MQEDFSSWSDMEKVKRSRLITAIKTPYTSTGRIDLNAYEQLVEFQIANGVDGLVVPLASRRRFSEHDKGEAYVAQQSVERTDRLRH